MKARRRRLNAQESLIEQNRFAQHFWAKGGFTLVELMVVVGLVGTLATIAQVNYIKFVARARQTEAKIGLADLYAAQKAFSAEHSSYTYCLRQTGFFMGGGGGKRYYAIGFLGSDTGNCGPNGNSSCFVSNWNPDLPCSVSCGAFDAGVSDNMTPPTTKASDSALLLNSCANLSAVPGLVWGYSPSQSFFIAVAIGNVSDSNLYDKWSIREAKILRNTAPGL